MLLILSQLFEMSVAIAFYYYELFMTKYSQLHIRRICRCILAGEEKVPLGSVPCRAADLTSWSGTATCIQGLSNILLGLGLPENM